MVKQNIKGLCVDTIDQLVQIIDSDTAVSIFLDQLEDLGWKET